MKKIIFAVLLCVFFVGLNLAFANQIGKVEVSVIKQDDIAVINNVWIAVRKIWRRFNRDPFRKYLMLSEEQLKRDRKGLRLMGLTSEQIDEIIAKHISGRIQEGFRRDYIREGDEFIKIIFGDFRIWQNVVVAWNGKQLARVFSISDGIEVWHPIGCGNWAVKEVEMVRPDEEVAIKVAKEVKVPKEELEEVEVPKEAPEKEEEIEAEYQWDWDSTWGGFSERYDDGNKVKGWWQSTTIYPYLFKDKKGNQWSLGLNYTSRNWSGETGESDPFHYKGSPVDIFALAERFRDTDRNWEILGRFGLGQRKDSGYLTNQWGRYEMEQETDVFNIYSSAEYNGRRDERWFSKVRGSIELEFAYNEQKKDYWIDQWSGRQALGGQPDDKDSYNFVLYADVFNFDSRKDIQIWGEYRSTYYDEKYKWGNGIKVGLSFLDGSFKIGAGYTYWNKDNPDSTGFYAEINLYSLYHKIFGYKEKRPGDFSFVDQEEKEREILELLTE